MKAKWLLKSLKIIKFYGYLKNDMFNMLAECCNKRSQNMCVVARKCCTYVLYSVVYNKTAKLVWQTIGMVMGLGSWVYFKDDPEDSKFMWNG